MKNFIDYDKDKILKLRDNLAKIQAEFYEKFGVNDIFSNSKVYEVIVANELNHSLIKGHSGSRDAIDELGEYEYKHFKKSSSNHSWTFNDFSDNTIEKLNDCQEVIFAHINDTKLRPVLDWYYRVPGSIVSKYLLHRTPSIKNTRKMINISALRIERDLKIHKTRVSKINQNGIYYHMLKVIFNSIGAMEKETHSTGLLTSNKIFELLTAVTLGHNMESEQGGRAGAHDAYDRDGNLYEYKISKAFSWNFQDISDKVLEKYLSDKAIMLVIKNPELLEIIDIYYARPNITVDRLRKKLDEKRQRTNGKLRRLQVSLSKGDLEKISAKKIL
jgi:hypothetical protein